jgi:hypothetical protein
VSAPEVIYWRSVGGGHWVLVDVLPTSVVGRWLAEHPGEIYEPDPGIRFRCDQAVKP